MARLINGATDEIDHGAMNAIDDALTLTVLGWVYPTVLDGSSFKMFGGKGVNTFFTIDNTAGFGQVGGLRVRIVHATTNLDYRSAVNTVTTNKWWFVAYMVDINGSAGKKAQLYAGDLGTVVSEVTYDTQQDPAGARTSDAAANWTTGNILDGFVSSARYANVMIFNRVLLLAEIQMLQFRPFNSTGCQLWSPYYGSPVEPDWSGNGNNGTLGGTSIADHVPLGSPLSWDWDWQGEFTAPAPAGLTYTGEAHLWTPW